MVRRREHKAGGFVLAHLGRVGEKDGVFNILLDRAGNGVVRVKSVMSVWDEMTGRSFGG
jgi:hypothetical protein